jgi:phosphoribosylanthranilate isomerase
MARQKVKICCISSIAEARLAIEQVKPHGLDLCSGVRTDGELDGAKLREFMKAVRM